MCWPFLPFLIWCDSRGLRWKTFFIFPHPSLFWCFTLFSALRTWSSSLAFSHQHPQKKHFGIRCWNLGWGGRHGVWADKVPHCRMMGTRTWMWVQTFVPTLHGVVQQGWRDPGSQGGGWAQRSQEQCQFWEGGFSTASTLPYCTS